MKEEETLLLQEVQMSPHEATVSHADQDDGDGEDLGDEGQVFQIDTRQQPILKDAAIY